MCYMSLFQQKFGKQTLGKKNLTDGAFNFLR